MRAARTVTALVLLAVIATTTIPAGAAEPVPMRSLPDTAFQPFAIARSAPVAPRTPPPAPEVIVEPGTPPPVSRPPVEQRQPKPVAVVKATPKPTPKPKSVRHIGQGHVATGTPTYYCWAGRSRCTRGYPDVAGKQMYAAAGPSLRVGKWRGRQVRVCADVCIVVTLIDWCACGGDHFIDLYHDAFVALGSPRRAKVTWD